MNDIGQKSAGMGLRGARGGFTLLEILLVCATIMLLTSLFLVGAGLLASREEKTMEQVFEQAVREARWLALNSERPVSMAFDDDGQAFVLLGTDGEVLETFRVEGRAAREGRTSVRFLQQSGRGTYVLIRGELFDTRTVDKVAFFPDGSSTPFAIELAYGDDRREYAIDPWTGARFPAEE